MMGGHKVMVLPLGGAVGAGATCVGPLLSLTPSRGP